MKDLFANSYRNWFYKFGSIFIVLMITYVILHASKIYDQEEIVNFTDQEQANITALVDNYVADDSQQIRFSFLDFVADPKNLLANTAEIITALKDLDAAMGEKCARKTIIRKCLLRIYTLVSSSTTILVWKR